MAKYAALVSALAVGLLSSACGSGGSGSPQPGPSPANSPPAFASQGNVSVAENSGGIVYSPVVTDPDGDPLTFSLSGGADQARFRITTVGALSFAEPPDFEDPTDADGDNVYLVQISVGDGRTSTVQNVTVIVTNAGPDAFRVSRVGAGFDQPVYVAPVPDGSGRIFVVERPGRIRILNPATGAVAPAPFLEISNQTTTDSERGLLGFATAPDFATSGVFYVYLTNLAGNSEVRRYSTLPGNRDQGDAASGDIILAFDQPSPTIMAAGLTSMRTASFTSGPAMAAAAAIRRTTPRTPATCSARSSGSTCAATPSRPTPHAIMRSRPAIRSPMAEAGRKSGPTASATRTAQASIRSPGTFGSAMSAKAPERRST